MDPFLTFHIPKQTPPKSRYFLEGTPMKALLTSYPPLSQVTLVKGTTVEFTVLLITDKIQASGSWEIALWHSNGGTWQESPLSPSSTSHPTIIQTSSSSTGDISHHLYFKTKLDIVSFLSFTIKFRSGADQPWNWVNDHQRTIDGTVLLESKTVQLKSENIDDIVEDINPIFKTSKVLSDTPSTTVWSVRGPVDAAKGDESTFTEIKFGLPWSGKILRWFALIRVWSPWLAPRQGKGRFELDKEAIVCSFMNREGRHLVLLAISGVDDVTTLFKSDKDGNIWLSIRNDSQEPSTARLVAAVGDDFESANAAVMYYARIIVRNDERASGEQQRELQAAREDINPKWMENWFDGLTYCTWNGLGQQLTDQKVLNAVDILAAHDINITNLIIDDNWQSIDRTGNGQFQHGWIEFEADPKAFPMGLKQTVSKIRERHKHIQHVAVWHALLGYWAGISPNGEIAQAYRTVEVNRVESSRRNLPMGGKMTVVAKEDAFRMYDDFYRFLSGCGIDAVKTDAQFMLDTIESAKARHDLFMTYLDAWTISSLKHFSTKAISCMSQTPQIIFHSELPQNKPAILLRNSDDFFPKVESSHPWHVFANAHNSLFTQHLNSLPDWDMFQTVHNYSGFHAAARCVSGGPVYITDVPGQHDVGLIKQMTGQTTRGSMVIFRPNVGKSLDAYVGYDDEVLLKVGAYHGAAVTGTSFIGIFNISQRPLTEFLPLSRFPGVIDAQYYIVRSHATGQVTAPMQTIDTSSLLSITLDTRGYDILSAFPLRGFVLPAAVLEAHTTWIANLGLLGKMTGAAAIVSNAMTVEGNRKIKIETNLKALGVLGLYISSLPSEPDFIGSHLLVTIQGRVVPVHVVSVSSSCASVVEIDLMKTWSEMGLDSGWENEIQVKVFLS